MDPIQNKNEQIQIAGRLIEETGNYRDVLRLAELVLAMHDLREYGGSDSDVTDVTVSVYRSRIDGKSIIQIDSSEDAVYRVDINDVNVLKAYDGGERIDVAEHLVASTVPSRSEVLDQMEEEVYQLLKEKGWDTERSIGDDVALLHSEVSEMLEAYRDGGLADHTAGEGCKPEGFGSEAADVLIRLLDTCRRRGVDLAWEYERKMRFNQTRPHRHGGKLL